MKKIKSTTIIGVRHKNKVAMAGDGQVTFGDMAIKQKAVKIRDFNISKNKVLGGFAGAAADALTLFEKFEQKLEQYEGDIKRAEAAQDKASDVANMVYKYGFHATLKFLLSERLSIDCGEPRKPTPDLTSGQKSIIAAKARELGLDKVTLGSVKN